MHDLANLRRRTLTRLTYLGTQRALDKFYSDLAWIFHELPAATAIHEISSLKGYTQGLVLWENVFGLGDG